MRLSILSMKEMASETENRPCIGITVRFDGYSEWLFSRGGTCCLMEPGGKLPLDRLSGLLLTGGEDVDPSLYGEANRLSRRVNPARDKFELEVLRLALISNLPVLAICRGMQLMVVASGGTLYQDLTELPPPRSNQHSVCHRSPDHRDTTHLVELEPLTLLNPSANRRSVLVNSHHHQGIRTLPAGFSISACSSDGLIEAVQSETHLYRVGVQWHPERWADRSSEFLMDGFLVACHEHHRRSE